MSPDTIETLVLGKVFVIFFMGEAGRGIPYTGVYFNDMRYLDYYALKLGNSLQSPTKIEKNGAFLKYEYFDNASKKTTRTVRLFYDGIEEEIRSESAQQVHLEISPAFSDLFYVRELVGGTNDEKRWRFKHKTIFKIAKDSCEIDCMGTHVPILKMFVHSRGIIRKERRLLINPKQRHFKILISFSKSRVAQHFTMSSLYESFPKVSCDNLLFQSLYSDSVINLSNTLDCPKGNSSFPLSGVPWYHAIFGRDSAITSLHSILFHPQIARSTILTLGDLIGKKFDKGTEEEPGKIIHEKRFGIMSGRDPKLKGYYGSVDATPLYVLTYLDYMKHHPQDKSVASFENVALKALQWIKRKVANERLLGYSPSTLPNNQAWKDSTDSVSHSDGSLPPHPLYLIEVQGYAAKAMREGATIAPSDSEGEEMQTLSSQLSRTIEERYWSEKLHYFGEALDGNGRLTEILTSNPGHLLWMSVIQEKRAKAIARVLVDRDSLNSGFGVKTLAYNEVRHDPTSYHNGSVWPHDNMIMLCGLANYGLVDEFSLLLSELLRAYDALGLRGLPELFSGERAEKLRSLNPMGTFPIPWSDAGIFGIIHSMLGLRFENEDGGTKRKIILSPTVPSWLNRLSVNGLYIMDGRMKINLERRGEKIAANFSFPSEPKKNVKVEVLD
ncbi:MAG: hypothetical protein PXY39_00200 [archaeon]|nr:hypothetical protein [archaeon]